jgi:hypothetical protein
VSDSVLSSRGWAHWSLSCRDKLRLCVLESLRRVPAVNSSALVPDKAFKCPFAKPSVLGPCKGRSETSESITFPAGTPICASIINHSLNENVWPEPESFKPYDRNLWGEGTRFCGFNGVGDKGPRMCPGRDVALELMITALQVIYSPNTHQAKHITFLSKARKDAQVFFEGVHNNAVSVGFAGLYHLVTVQNKDDYLSDKLDDVVKAWTALVVGMRHPHEPARVSTTIKHFMKKGPKECQVVTLRKDPLMHIRFAKIDEDASDFGNYFSQFISDVLALTQHVIDDDKGLYYYKSNEEAKAIGMGTFNEALPTSEVSWDLAEIETSAGFTKLIFHGIGQAFLTNVRSSRAVSLTVPAAYEVDLEFLSNYGVRKGYETYGASAFFDANKEPIAIWYCHANRMVYASGDHADWLHAMAVMRTTLSLAITVKEHLAFVHLVVANGVHLAMQETLSPTHPLRRILKPHGFRTTTINLAASGSLIVVNGLAYDGFGIDAANYQRAFCDCVGLFKYESFPDYVASKGLNASDNDFCPYFKDGIEFWNIVHQYVDNYLQLFYPNGTADVLRDGELLTYWNHFSGPHQLGAQSYGLPELTYPALVDQATHFIFQVTAQHEFAGSIVEYLLGPNVLPPKLATGRNSSDLQTFHLGLALISLTGNRMPMLINDWEHLHSYLLDAGTIVECPTVNSADMDARRTLHSKVLIVLENFKGDLLKQSGVIDARNMDRAKDPKRKPFNSLNPRIMECSVSV